MIILTILVPRLGNKASRVSLGSSLSVLFKSVKQPLIILKKEKVFSMEAVRRTLPNDFSNSNIRESGMQT